MHTELSLPLGLLFGFLAVLARVAGALSFVPVPGLKNAPLVARAVLALSLTVALSPLWPELPSEPSIGWMLMLVGSESALGITIGVAVALLMETLLVAAQVFGMQAGYSYASTVNPSNEADSSVLLVLAELMAGLLFFALGLDGQVLRALASSLTTHPPGTFLLKPASAQIMIALGAGMLATGAQLALPIVLLLMLIDVALALLGRMQQQLQLITLAFPIKMLATLAFLAALAALYVPVYRAAAARTFAALSRML
jgi:flagellar biosynthesis protein FliR